jgi:hypothetical protein
MTRLSVAAETKLAQYEVPAFVAGGVNTLVDQVEELIKYHIKQEGRTQALVTSLLLLERVKGGLKSWQRLAACVTDYKYTREIISGSGSDGVKG